MADNRFNEDLYAKAKFPITLFDGIYFRDGDVIREIDSEKDLRLIITKFNHQTIPSENTLLLPKDFTSSRLSLESKLSLDIRLEKELVLLGHSYEAKRGMPLSIQEFLADSRQEKAYSQCLLSERKVNEKKIQSIPYHDLAFFYYTLMHGQSTLGYNATAEKSYVSPMRELQRQGITSPKVLLLGFSSIFSLENLAAMLHLVGFKQSSILAIDKSKDPLDAAKTYYGNQLFSSKIEYLEQDILADKLDEKIAGTKFDFIATHLFFTHFPDELKKEIWKRIPKLLSSDGIFADEEIFVNGAVDRNAYNYYFRTLVDNLKFNKSNDIVRADVGNFMYKFASTGPFNPYNNISFISYDAEKKAGLKIQMPFLSRRNIWASGGGVITADMHTIYARK